MEPPSYRERLRIEGLALAGCGAIGSLALIALVPDARRRPLSTVGQLAVVAVLLEAVGTRKVREWMDHADELKPGEEGGGEATPLWMLPPIVAGLAAAFVLLPHTGLPFTRLAGWDAGLRVTVGCTLVGLAQGLRYAGVVGKDESEHSRRYIRVKGSHLWSGTKLGWVPA
jgi:hypothetical protein